MVTKVKKDFSVASLLQDNNKNNHDYSRKWNTIPIINNSTITPSEHRLKGKYLLFFFLMYT